MIIFIIDTLVYHGFIVFCIHSVSTYLWFCIFPLYRNWISRLHSEDCCFYIHFPSHHVNRYNGWRKHCDFAFSMQITNYIHAYENTTLFNLYFNMYIVKMTNINNKLIIHIVNMLIKKKHLGVEVVGSIAGHVKPKTKIWFRLHNY